MRKVVRLPTLPSKPTDGPPFMRITMSWSSMALATLRLRNNRRVLITLITLNITSFYGSSCANNGKGAPYTHYTYYTYHN
eukprot:3793258-Pyramimonas_sp.AAC.1